MATTDITAPQVDLRFDLTRPDHLDTDGALNPHWVKAAQPFDVVSGDLGPIGRQRVAIHTVEPAPSPRATDPRVRYFGRDYLGRAVVLTEVAS